MDASTLLRELEPLDHGGRMRRMVALGRASRGDRTLSATLDALARGGTYERMLALQSCAGSGDGARAALAMADPSGLIRRRAASLVARYADDAHALEALRAARREDRLALLRRLARRGRRAPVDGLIDELAALDDERLPGLLPFGTAAGIAGHLAKARGRGGPGFWGRLARHHPDLAADTLLARARSATVVDARLLREANAALIFLGASRPDMALALVVALARFAPLELLELRALIRTRPVGVADLVLASDDEKPPDLGPVVHRIDDARLLSLLERRPFGLADRQRSFRRLDPARRAALFEARGASWRFDSDESVPVAIVALLPRGPREREARRNLALPALATRPVERFPYAGLLPWDEARRALDPWIGHPEGDLRGQALAALASSVRYQRGRLGDLLAMAEARRHERDPVRLALLSALAQLPPSAFLPEHLAALGRVIRAALDAADLSHATAAAAESLAVRLLPRHPDWGVEWLVALVRERGHVSRGDLEGVLTDGDVRRIAPALAPVLASWQGREREGPLLILAQALGKRLPAFGALADILGTIAHKSPAMWFSSQALGLIGRHDRPRFANLVPALLEADPSWATQPQVYLHLHRRRQDMLTPFLGQKAYWGRFSTGNTRFVLPLAGGFFRWTASQQATFSATLEEVTRGDDPMRDTPAVIQALGQLAALSAPDPSGRLAELAADPRPAVRDAALRALGRLDADQGVPALLGALDDDRARVAIHALRKALLGMPATRALGLLRAVPLAKVTVAKEVLRLLGELPGPEAFGLLLEFDGRPLHRDARVALLRALWGHLERPEAWGPIERAADDPDPALLSGVVRIPADRLSDGARRRLATVLLRLLHHREPAIRLATLTRCAEAPAGDPDRNLLARALALVGTGLPDERSAAAKVVRATATPADAPLVAGEVARLLADRRAIATVVNELGFEAKGDLGRLAPVVRAVLGALAHDPLTAKLRATIAPPGPLGRGTRRLLRGHGRSRGVARRGAA